MDIRKEFERLQNLSEFNIDYESLDEGFTDLNKIAANIATTEISQLNLIDNFLQWSVSQIGTTDLQTPREETICTYTVESEKPMEVLDLGKDTRFQNLEAVKAAGARYYYGVPLISKEGFSIGSLCVISLRKLQLSEHQKELIKLVADIAIKKLEDLRELTKVKQEQAEAEKSKREVAHDLRGMINGVMGLGDLIEIENSGSIEKIDKILKLHKGSCKSILEYADTILSEKNGENNEDEGFIDIEKLTKKLERLYLPLAFRKKINLNFSFEHNNLNLQFDGKLVLQIIGNLISNAIKFTDADGTVDVYLSVLNDSKPQRKILKVVVKDDGIGMNKSKIESILNKKGGSTEGTDGEQGYGIGLNLVLHHLDQIKGSILVDSAPDKGSSFTISIPVN